MKSNGAHELGLDLSLGDYPFHCMLWLYHGNKRMGHIERAWASGAQASPGGLKQ